MSSSPAMAPFPWSPKRPDFALPGSPQDYAVGFKEVIELPPRTIEERFGVRENEGAAHLFLGSLTKGRFGGGFLYTNRSSLSLGLVLRIQDLMEHAPLLEAPRFLDDFKNRPEIAPLIAGGETVEYSAHVLPEAGFGGLIGPFADGLLIAGDAAGFSLNMGLTVRGMEFALASGVLAARTILRARENKDFSASSLSVLPEASRSRALSGRISRLLSRPLSSWIIPVSSITILIWLGIFFKTFFGSARIPRKNYRPRSGKQSPGAKPGRFSRICGRGSRYERNLKPENQAGKECF